MRNEILIIDDSVNDFVDRRKAIIHDLSRQGLSVNYDFFHAQTLDQGITLIREHRDSLCAILLDKALTASGKSDLSTTQHNRLRNLEATIHEMMHPQTLFCISVDGTEDELKAVSRELHRGQWIERSRPTFPTQIINTRDSYAIGEGLAQAISNAHNIGQAHTEKAIEDLSDRLETVQNVLWRSSTDGKALSIVDSINKHGEMLKEIMAKLDGLAFKGKIIDSLLEGRLGQALMVFFGVAVLMVLGVNVAEIVTNIVQEWAK